MNVYELRVYCEKLKELEYEHGNRILFDESYTCVSLHVRMNYCRINYNTNFFVKAIQYFKGKYPNVVFLVFSNDIDLVKDWFQTVEDIKYVILSNKYDYLDLWAMSLCIFSNRIHSNKFI